MSRSRGVHGSIQRRLLVNVLVDPDEAAAHLPAGLRPHETADGTVVGCCLLELADVRPAALPAPAGVRLRAAAHRISAEWEDGEGHTIVGVYVPERRTDSFLAAVVGGRAFPGVHRRVPVEVHSDATTLRWSVADDLRVEVRRTRDAADPTCGLVGGTCLTASVGLSPDRRGGLEAVQMAPAHHDARQVEVHQLASTFLDGFTSARPAPAYLMEDVPVAWSSVPARLPSQLSRSAVVTP
jgi:hypothetical protein